MWVIFALAAWPLIEIALFVQIGGMLGVWGTVAWVLATGALGLLLLLPPVQALILAALARRVSGSGFTMEFETRTRRQRPDIIDGDFHEVPPDQLPPRGRSGWQDH